MKSPLHRIRFGAVLLGIIVVVSVVGYRVLGQFDWMEAVWMTVITIASVGFGERSQLPPSLQLFTVLVILFGMSATAYTIGGLLQVVLEGELDRILGRRRMTREIGNLERHVIICGYGRIGATLAEELKRRGRPLVVIDKEVDRILQARDCDHLTITGDATEDHVLLNAGLQKAGTLVSALPNDAANVFITLTARNLNPNIQVIARADLPTSERKLRQAGAHKVVLPTLIGAEKIARMITRPVASDFIDLISARTFLAVELEELVVPESSRLVGVSVLETEARRRHRLLVVGVKKLDGEIVFNPDADYRFAAGDVVVIMGGTEDIQRFRKEYELAP